MSQTIGYVTLVVRAYDEAIVFFTQSLGFDLIEDTPAKDRQGRDKRWVLVAPRGSGGTALLLAEASSPEEATRPRLPLYAHRRFLARLQEDERKGSELCQRT